MRNGFFSSRSVAGANESMEENLERSAPAIFRAYRFVGSVLFFGGAGYLLDRWMATTPWLLIAGLIVGVLVSIVQTVTSIQDNILSFMPRAAAIFIVFALTFPWMLRVVTGFAGALFRRLPDLVR